LVWRQQHLHFISLMSSQFFFSVSNVQCIGGTGPSSHIH
jgi:hypothetical protein